MEEFKFLEDIGLDEEYWPQVQKWLDRGDHIAVYENHAMDSSMLGHRKFVSFGSKDCQIETDEPPQRLPDIGSQINWAYQLIGVLRSPGKQEKT